MESIWGKQSRLIGAQQLGELLRDYPHRLIDLGCGDGRFVQHVAHCWDGYFAIGIDACRENLRTVSRKAPGNALFLIANACTLPCELYGQATEITVNFPWGSLLDGLLTEDSALLDGLAALAQPGAGITVRLNKRALEVLGWSTAAGARQVQEMLTMAGFQMRPPLALTNEELSRLPTTWAKRLAHGRAAGAIALSGARRADGEANWRQQARQREVTVRES
jgi:16S rRNA (adenine(1408)-N(1))-methyltransferase